MRLGPTNAMFTRDTFTWGKCISQLVENVTQYSRNVNLPQKFVSYKHGITDAPKWVIENQTGL